MAIQKRTADDGEPVKKEKKEKKPVVNDNEKKSIEERKRERDEATAEKKKKKKKEKAAVKEDDDEDEEQEPATTSVKDNLQAAVVNFVKINKLRDCTRFDLDVYLRERGDFTKLQLTGYTTVLFIPSYAPFLSWIVFSTLSFHSCYLPFSSLRLLMISSRLL